jgi:hypothetical protein
MLWSIGHANFMWVRPCQIVRPFFQTGCTQPFHSPVCAVFRDHPPYLEEVLSSARADECERCRSEPELEYPLTENAAIEIIRLWSRLSDQIDLAIGEAKIGI